MSITKHVKDTCKIGQGQDCCRYLVVGGQGFECAKYTDNKSLLDARAINGDMTARSNNCKGYPMEESIKLLNNKS